LVFEWLTGPKRAILRFDPTPADGRIPKLNLSSFNSSDTDACINIYRLNEAAHFPPGLLGEFKRTLSAYGTRFVVARYETEVVGIGGIAPWRRGPLHVVPLVFGMVHPQWQRRGVGSALLLARLASLPEPKPYWRVSLSPLRGSQSFYARFGFTYAGSLPYLHLHTDWHDLHLYADEWRRCKEILIEAGVQWVQLPAD
jgi:GNAT superfamily N-acetyltransferase